MIAVVDRAGRTIALVQPSPATGMVIVEGDGASLALTPEDARYLARALLAAALTTEVPAREDTHTVTVDGAAAHARRLAEDPPAGGPS